MERRAFLAGVAAALAAPRAAGAQQAGRVYRIGAIGLSSTLTPAVVRLREAFLAGLHEHGYVEGKNIVLEWRYSEGRTDRFPQLVAELLGLKVDLLMVFTTPAARAAKAATGTVPILLLTAIDPVGAGFAASLARPGGNVTGIATLSPELAAKRIELIRELLPRASRVGVLWNAGNPANAPVRRQTDEAARRLGLALRAHEVQGPDDFAARFAAIAQERPDALLVPSDALMFQYRHQIARLALEARLPTLFEPREMAEAGGLLAYGPSYAAIFRRGAFYVDRLLKGVKPADLPFEQPNQFELVLNLKTAKALGLTVPQSLLLRADQVIE